MVLYIYRVYLPQSMNLLTFFLYSLAIIMLSYYVHVENLYVLDEQGEVAAFNTRTNPALQMNTWSYSEELGKQASPILPRLQAHPAFWYYTQKSCMLR